MHPFHVENICFVLKACHAQTVAGYILQITPCWSSIWNGLDVVHFIISSRARHSNSETAKRYHTDLLVFNLKTFKKSLKPNLENDKNYKIYVEILKTEL